MAYFVAASVQDFSSLRRVFVRVPSSGKGCRQRTNGGREASGCEGGRSGCRGDRASGSRDGAERAALSSLSQQRVVWVTKAEIRFY